MVPTHLPKPLTHDIPRVVPGIRAVKPLTLTGAKEETLPNGIKIYGFDTERQAYAKLVEEFPSLWKDDGFIKVPPEEWMRIPLKDGWQDKLTGRSKIYPLGIEDRKLVDETFDNMHEQGRLKWTDEETPFSFPVFVVWKLINGKRKGRAVADIRGLNDMIMPDAYPVPLQGEIINDLRGCDRLSVLDAMSFFYQWRVHSSDTFKLTIVTHRGQETFLVPVMGCRNSIAYVQRRMDRLLHEWRGFVKAYIDDVIVRSRTFSEHMVHLRKVFTLFTAHNIIIGPTKTFLGYTEIHLLGQRVNSIGLSTAESKLEAIAKPKFPSTLSQLETFLGMTGYLRKFIPRYAAVTKPLQDMKTSLLKSAPTKGQKRKNYSTRTKISNASPDQIQAFTNLKKALSRSSILIHFDPDRILYIDIDASHEFGFGVMLFMIRSKESPKNN